ncbi:TPA: GatB/YqeY domain-containing protein [Candidatus Poribacteria bacterium]|nr:GatB/YqeY domain-containing protein [Candidatus Poribacteria bacterium]HEX30254.1 GatB/YqeY domain-containing protein [Candidatus Poribacteria bacterium]
MTLKEKLLGDLKRAMKEKDRSALNAIRMITNDIKNREIELRRELDDGEIAQLISAQVRKREEAIEQFRKGNRMDLVEEESRQVELLKSYLPKPLSQEELSQMIDEAIEEAGAKSPKDLGKVMRLIMPKVRGRADGKLVNQMVRNKLGG